MLDMESALTNWGTAMNAFLIGGSLFATLYFHQQSNITGFFKEELANVQYKEDSPYWNAHSQQRQERLNEARRDTLKINPQTMIFKAPAITPYNNFTKFYGNVYDRTQSEDTPESILNVVILLSSLAFSFGLVYSLLTKTVTPIVEVAYTGGWVGGSKKRKKQVLYQTLERIEQREAQFFKQLQQTNVAFASKFMLMPATVLATSWQLRLSYQQAKQNALMSGASGFMGVLTPLLTATYGPKGTVAGETITKGIQAYGSYQNLSNQIDRSVMQAISNGAIEMVALVNEATGAITEEEQKQFIKNYQQQSNKMNSYLDVFQRQFRDTNAAIFTLLAPDSNPNRETTLTNAQLAARRCPHCGSTTHFRYDALSKENGNVLYDNNGEKRRACPQYRVVRRRMLLNRQRRREGQQPLIVNNNTVTNSYIQQENRFVNNIYSIWSWFTGRAAGRGYDADDANQDGVLNLFQMPTAIAVPMPSAKCIPVVPVLNLKY